MLFCTFLLLLHDHDTKVKYCVLRVEAPGAPWFLTFTLGQLGNLSF